MRILIMILFLVSCSDNITFEQNVNKTRENIEGVYYFEHGGSIETTVDQYNRVTITMLDYLTSINPQNSTFGEHPRTTINDQFLDSKGVLRYSTNVNYNNGDLERDDNGANITGSRRTDFEFKWIGDKLEVEIQVFESTKNNNVNSIILNRILKGER